MSMSNVRTASSAPGKENVKEKKNSQDERRGLTARDGTRMDASPLPLMSGLDFQKRPKKMMKKKKKSNVGLGAFKQVRARGLGWGP